MKRLLPLCALVLTSALAGRFANEGRWVLALAAFGLAAVPFWWIANRLDVADRIDGLQADLADCEDISRELAAEVLRIAGPADLDDLGSRYLVDEG